MVDEFDANRSPLQTVNILKAIRWAITTWTAVSTTTITRCFHHTKLFENPEQAAQTAEEQPIQEITSLI